VLKTSNLKTGVSGVSPRFQNHQRLHSECATEGYGIVAWIRTNSLWNRKFFSHWSSEMAEIRLPSSVRNSAAAVLSGPSVSTAIGVKICNAAMLAYFVSLRVAAASDALPATDDVSVSCRMRQGCQRW
jgi:hypothetical protein